MNCLIWCKRACSKAEPSCQRYMYPPRAIDVYAPLVMNHSSSGIDPQQPLLIRQANDAANQSNVSWLWSPGAAQTGPASNRLAFWPSRHASSVRAGYMLRLSHLQLDWEHVGQRAQGSVLYPTNDLLRASFGEPGAPTRQPAFLPAAPADMQLGVCFLESNSFFKYCTLLH